MRARRRVARVHGAALGGGMGLAAACDICVASTKAQFATSEVRLGIIPAAIGPYVDPRDRRAPGLPLLPDRRAHRRAERAREIGLVHEVAEPDELDARVQQVVDALLAGGPLAQAAATDLIRAVANRPVDDAVVEDTARRIASCARRRRRRKA